MSGPVKDTTYAYVADQGTVPGITVVDVSNPASPQIKTIR